MKKIEVPDKVLKMRIGNLAIWDLDYLLDNLPREVKMLEELKRWRDQDGALRANITLEDIRKELREKIQNENM